VNVLELWRHPVKSLQGEQLGEAVLEPGGLVGDRAWGIQDLATGNILTGRREPALLLAAARLGDDGRPRITRPDGTELVGVGEDTDRGLSDWIGRPVSLVAAAGAEGGTAEFFVDPLDDTGPAGTWTMPAGGHFVDTLPLLLVTTASLRQGAVEHPEGQWDVRRFRPNVLVETEGTGWQEDAWCKHSARVADGDGDRGATLAVRARCTRCTMVTRPQPGGLERDLDMFRTLSRGHDSTLGVWARVQTPGIIRVGDPLTID
jgi:uncharacterized protein YcbX